jgi:hypothetical protein
MVTATCFESSDPSSGISIVLGWNCTGEWMHTFCGVCQLCGSICRPIDACVSCRRRSETSLAPSTALKRQCSRCFSNCYSGICLEGLGDSTKKPDSFRSLRNGISTCLPAELVTSWVLCVSLQSHQANVQHSTAFFSPHFSTILPSAWFQDSATT